jgi:hypothetical protein
MSLPGRLRKKETAGSGPVEGRAPQSGNRKRTAGAQQLI